MSHSKSAWISSRKLTSWKRKKPHTEARSFLLDTMLNTPRNGHIRPCPLKGDYPQKKDSKSWAFLSQMFQHQIQHTNKVGKQHVDATQRHSDQEANCSRPMILLLLITEVLLFTRQIQQVHDFALINYRGPSIDWGLALLEKQITEKRKAR
jgi:hypothetical protein